MTHPEPVIDAPFCEMAILSFSIGAAQQQMALRVCPNIVQKGQIMIERARTAFEKGEVALDGTTTGIVVQDSQDFVGCLDLTESWSFSSGWKAVS